MSSISTLNFGVVNGVDITGNATLASANVGFIRVTADAILTIPAGTAGYPYFRIVPSKSGIKITLNPQTSGILNFNCLDTIAGATPSADKDLVWVASQAGCMLELFGYDGNNWFVTHFDDKIESITRET